MVHNPLTFADEGPFVSAYGVVRIQALEAPSKRVVEGHDARATRTCDFFRIGPWCDIHQVWHMTGMTNETLHRGHIEDPLGLAFVFLALIFVF
jgi:hypothetical protein